VSMPTVSVPDYTVPILLIAGLLALGLALTSTPAVAGRLLRADGLIRAVSEMTARRRVAPFVPILLSALGVAAGLAAGGILSGVTEAGIQGWLVGGGLAIAGFLVPRAMFIDGWNARFVRRMNADVLVLLQTVYVLSAVGRKPVDEAIRAFAHAWAGRSALADVLLGCPSSESPVQLMRELDVPGQPFAMMVLALRQAQEISEAQRKRVLGERVQAGIMDLKHAMMSLAKKRAQMAVIVGVLILLPTLMIAILVPPLMNVAGYFTGF
jgi:hypothetical protein